MAIEDRSFVPGDMDDRKDLKKAEKKLKKALKSKDVGKKKLKKIKKKLAKVNVKLSVYRSVTEERELRHQAELQAAKLETVLQMLLKGNEKLALPEVVVQYDR